MSERQPTSDVPATEQQPVNAERLLTTFLQHRDVLCPRCGYNLRNLTVPICPECHESISLRVDVQPRPIHWLLIALVPHMFCTGMAILFLYFVVREGFPRMRATEALTTYAMLLSAVVGVTIGVFHRRFLRLKPDLQILFLVLTLIAHVILLLIVVNQV